MDGILNLDKPAGPSSAQVVGQIKRLLPRGVKVGHAGTLDPFATGVLLILIGKATRCCEMLMDQPKGYEATLTFGATTETDDNQSPPRPVAGAAAPDVNAIETALAALVGTIQQVPPAYSALKIGGRRAYKLARQGKPVELAARSVRIDRAQLVHYEWPHARIVIDCGRGTYIRSIARDVGQTLGVGGYLTQLRRTRVGIFAAAAAVTIQSLQTQGIAPHLIAPPTIAAAAETPR